MILLYNFLAVLFFCLLFPFRRKNNLHKVRNLHFNYYLCTNIKTLLTMKTNFKIVRFWVAKNYVQLFVIFFLLFIVAQFSRLIF